jgi:hypothetical protein
MLLLQFAACPGQLELVIAGDRAATTIRRYRLVLPCYLRHERRVGLGTQGLP